MTLKRLIIVLGVLVVLAGVGIMWLWQYAYSPEGRARIIIAQLKNDTTSLRGWMLQHHVVRQGFSFPPHRGHGYPDEVDKTQQPFDLPSPLVDRTHRHAEGFFQIAVENIGYPNTAYGYLNAAPPPGPDEYKGYRLANNIHHCGMTDYSAVVICLFSSQNSVVSHNLIHDISPSRIFDMVRLPVLPVPVRQGGGAGLSASRMQRGIAAHQITGPDSLRNLRSRCVGGKFRSERLKCSCLELLRPAIRPSWQRASSEHSAVN